jgi:periplasmic protein CpxP/Spy
MLRRRRLVEADPSECASTRARQRWPIHTSLRLSQAGFTGTQQHLHVGDRPASREIEMGEPKGMPDARPQRGSAWTMRALVAVIVVIAAASAAFSANAQGRHGHEMVGLAMFGGSPEHIGRAVDHLLDGLNASDAQRTQIKQIATAAATDLKAQHDAGRALRERALQAFTAPTVDANAAEALRQQMQAQQDQTSRRVLQAMLDVSGVLTPEQRAQIGQRIKQREATRQ